MKSKLKIICIIIVVIVVLAGIFCLTDYIIYNITGKSIALFKDKSQEPNWLIKEVKVNRDEFFEIHNSLGIIPKWEEMTIAQQFCILRYKNTSYDVRNVVIPEKIIGEKLGSVTLTEKDSHTNNVYNQNASYYLLKDFPEECAIAIKYEGTNEYYPAINAYYQPETLGDFIEDLNLKEIVFFSTIYYDYQSTDKTGNIKYEDIEFPNVDNDIIWQMLFADTTAKNLEDDRELHDNIMSISVNIPMFGYENIAVSVCKNGYITTNIFESGKTFYIGEDKVQSFVDYIIENYDGYKTVYVDENGKEISWDDYEEEDTEPEDDIIMVYNSTTNETKPYIPSNSNSSNVQNFTEAYNPLN